MDRRHGTPLIHHVFFWLKRPHSREDLDALLSGLRSLGKIEVVRQLHIGVPAATEARDVVDGSYSASELMFFDDIAALEHYQHHPIHQEFIATCAHLWDKVVVYDTMDVAG